MCSHVGLSFKVMSLIAGPSLTAAAPRCQTRLAVGGIYRMLCGLARMLLSHELAAKCMQVQQQLWEFLAVAPPLRAAALPAAPPARSLRAGQRGGLASCRRLP